MSTRWFGTQRELKHVSSRPIERDSMDPSGQPRFRKEEAFWRSWLATGARRVPIDRRRARGAESHLKKILVGAPPGAVDFSSAMARQAVDEALHSLPPQHKQVVKLAYFAGLTNLEIAQELGLSVSEVRRILRASLATVGAHFERGRAKGRRAIQDLLTLPWWPSLQKLGNNVHKAPWPALDHALQTGIVAVMTAAAVALLATHQPPANAGHTHKPPRVAAVGAVGAHQQSHEATLVAAVAPTYGPAGVTGAASHPASLAGLPVTVKVSGPLPVSVSLPSIVAKLRAPGLPQLPLGA
jgi:RNA polymerase sigma factor (sigma-70 family)